jgi:hypothetical protein
MRILVECVHLEKDFTEALSIIDIKIESVERSCNGHMDVVLVGSEKNLLIILEDYFGDDDLDAYVMYDE